MRRVRRCEGSALLLFRSHKMMMVVISLIWENSCHSLIRHLSFGFAIKTGLTMNTELAMNTMMNRLFAICISALAMSALAFTQTPPAYPNQKEADFVITDFKFQSGETLPALKLHYTTVGTPHKNAQGET